MFGFTAAEMYGKSILSLLPPSLSEGNGSLKRYFDTINQGNVI